MRKKNTERLSDVLSKVLKEQKLDKKLNELHVIEGWSEVLGKNISNYTTDLNIKNKILYVSLSSSVLRHDLFLSREEIINALNKYAGGEVITDIIFR